MSEPETAIVVRPNVLPSTTQFQMMRELAERLAYAEGFLPRHFFYDSRGNPTDPRTRPHRILAAIEYGRAVGIEPMVALQNITMIDGKAGASALLVGALLRRGGYDVESDVTDQQASVTVSKAGKVTGKGEFSLEDARRAGLLRDGSGWTKYPKDMLYARALTQAARRGAQDAMLGMAYTAEELGVETDEDGQASGEIAFDKASAESVAALQAEQVNRQAAGATSPPAPSQEVSGERSGTAAASPLPAAIQEPVPAMTQTPPQTASTRSGPRAKRGNVVAAPVAPQGAQSERSEQGHIGRGEPGTTSIAGEVNSPASATTSVPPVASLDAPLDGQEQYLDGLRQQAREAAAVIRHLQVKRENLLKTEQIKLGTATAQSLPVLTPNLEADDSLRQFVEKRFPGRKLVDLGEAELDGSDDAPGVLRALQSIIDALHGKGFHE